MALKTIFLLFKTLIKQNLRNFAQKLPWNKKALQKWERVSFIDFSDFYLITTVHTVKDNGGIYSENITRVNKDSDLSTLEDIVLRHLDDSIWHIKKPFKQNWRQRVEEITVEQNTDELMTNSRMISINRNDNIIEINSTSNRGSGKYDYKKESIRLSLPVNSEALKVSIHKALSRCD